MREAVERFIARARADNVILERNGAAQAAQARANLLADLEEALALWEDETVTVAEAASLTGANEETIRRAVRSGEVDDSRENPRGTIRVRRGDLERLKGKARKTGGVGTAQRAVDALLARV